ncbi:hypothetical protein EPUL_002196 [Erysiphe pulchra]|uniref:Uncharacterized protein n=1 Tax=Erysiphe pulchra TaxID=225359 RepID=A0A2S4PX91_9PEZI|nr:hypothetical protein EPUL_002196 [Erysiphe pulchra]
MAPLANKRTLLPEPPDAGIASRKHFQVTYSADALRKAEAIEKALRVSQCSTEEIIETEDDIMNEEMSDTSDSVQTKTPTPVQNTPYTTLTSPTKSQNPEISRCSPALMSDIKGLLDLTCQYLQDLEIKHPGVGSDFLALLTDGASRAMLGQRIYMAHPNQEIGQFKKVASWADVTAANISNHKANFFKRQKLKASAPQVQILDVWKVPSGFAILAQTPAKAAMILQAKTAIEEYSGNAVVERQETWTTFVIGPVQKRMQCVDGFRDPMDGLLHEEFAAVRETVPFKYMNWTRRSNNDEPCGHIRICIPESKAGKFPSRLRLFGEAVSVQTIRKRNQFLVCTKCHGFHTTWICTRSNKCHIYCTEEHTGPCIKPTRCLNCRDPHQYAKSSCPARPQRKNVVSVRPTGIQRKKVRAAGGRDFINLIKKQTTSQSLSSSGNSGADDTVMPQ